MFTLSAPGSWWPTLAAVAAWSTLIVVCTLRVTRRRPPDSDRGTRALFALLGAVALFLGGLGGWASFSTVEHRASEAIDKGGWGWGNHGWMVPVAIDVAILLFDGWELIASQMTTPDGRRRSARWMRIPPRFLIGVTIFLNSQDAGSTAASVSHAAVVSVYVLVVAYARHTIQPPVTDGDHEDGLIPWVRWVLRPYPTWRIWQMTKLEKVGWRAARDHVAAERIVRASLKSEHAGWWWWAPMVGWHCVPLDKRALFAAGRLQGLSEAADGVLASAATPGFAGVANPGNGGLAGGLAEGVAGGLPRALPAGLPVAGVAGKSGGDVGGGVAGDGRWVAAGVALLGAKGLPVEVADNVMAVAGALDALAGRGFGNPSQGQISKLAGVSRPTCGKWRKALEGYFVEPPTEAVAVAVNDAEGEVEGGSVVKLVRAQS